MMRARAESTGLVRKLGAISAAALVLLLSPAKLGTDLQLPPATSIAMATTSASVKPPAFRLAAFGQQSASAEVRHVANWAVHTGDHKSMSLVIVDKKAAQVFIFNPMGELMAVTPALLGSAVGDHTVPGIGNRPLSQVLPSERTTPAGRFVAEPGINTNGEDIVWVDYDAAVSLHRVRPNNKSERRLERLASSTADDNRISFGCINLPVEFYETVLSPAVRRTGAVIYVLPETRLPAEIFGSFEVAAVAQQQGR